MNDEHNAVFSFKDNCTKKEYHLDLEDIMLMVNVFEHVLQRIAQRKRQFMCYIVDHDLEDYPGMSPIARMACKQYIETSLNQDQYNYTMDCWLANHGCPNPTPELARRARMLWLNQTICRFTKILKEHHYPF